MRWKSSSTGPFGLAPGKEWDIYFLPGEPQTHRIKIIDKITDKIVAAGVPGLP